MGPRAVRSTAVSGGGRRLGTVGEGTELSNGYRISVGEDEQVLEMVVQ